MLKMLQCLQFSFECPITQYIQTDTVLFLIKFDISKCVVLLTDWNVVDANSSYLFSKLRFFFYLFLVDFMAFVIKTANRKSTSELHCLTNLLKM